MKKRTVRAFYTKMRGQLERVIGRIQGTSLEYGETREARDKALQEMRERAERYSENRRLAHQWRGGRKRYGRRGNSGIQVGTGKRILAKERLASKAAIARAHNHKLRPLTGKQRRAAEKVERRKQPGFGQHRAQVQA